MTSSVAGGRAAGACQGPEHTSGSQQVAAPIAHNRPPNLAPESATPAAASRRPGRFGAKTQARVRAEPPTRRGPCKLGSRRGAAQACAVTPGGTRGSSLGPGGTHLAAPPETGWREPSHLAPSRRLAQAQTRGGRSLQAPRPIAGQRQRRRGKAVAPPPGSRASAPPPPLGRKEGRQEGGRGGVRAGSDVIRGSGSRDAGIPRPSRPLDGKMVCEKCESGSVGTPGTPGSRDVGISGRILLS